MRSNNVLGFIFAATLDDKIPELASSRTTASVPIGGKYRIIDFDLSNMSNSGISNVGIVAKSNFQSLMDHVGSGSAYDLSKRRSNLSILPPYDGKALLKQSTICTATLSIAVRSMCLFHRAM